jgi:hypothetical protein
LTDSREWVVEGIRFLIYTVVLKDVPHFPLEMLKSRNEESARMQLFPNLDYKSLFSVVVQLIDVAPLIQFGVQCKLEIILLIIIEISLVFNYDCSAIGQHSDNTFCIQSHACYRFWSTSKLILFPIPSRVPWGHFLLHYIKKSLIFSATTSFRLQFVSPILYNPWINDRSILTFLTKTYLNFIFRQY